MRSPAAEPDDKGEYSQEAFAATVNRHARAAKAWRGAERIALPLLAGLPNHGTYRYAPTQFTALARFLFNGEPAKAHEAIKAGRFKFGKLEFVCDKSLTTGPTVSIAEFARASGTPKQTVSWRIGQFLPRSIGSGKRKRYYLADLEVLFGVSTKPEGIIDRRDSF